MLVLYLTELFVCFIAGLLGLLFILYHFELAYITIFNKYVFEETTLDNIIHFFLVNLKGINEIVVLNYYDLIHF